jgi:hypothetical protein
VHDTSAATGRSAVPHPRLSNRAPRPPIGGDAWTRNTRAVVVERRGVDNGDSHGTGDMGRSGSMAWEALDHRATTFPPSVCSVCIPDTEDLVAIVDLRLALD